MTRIFPKTLTALLTLCVLLLVSGCFKAMLGMAPPNHNHNYKTPPKEP